MINDKFIGKSSLRGRNYLLVDLELLQKEEFAQRRKLRIQQVRLQSKDLAARILHDVRNERKLHAKTVQNKQADLLKKVQLRKLHELRHKEIINAGQRAAAALPDPEEEISQRIRKNSIIAQERGKKAISQLRTEKEISRCQQEKLTAQRDRVKVLEGIRSAMVSSLSYVKNKRKPDNITSNVGERAGLSSCGKETPMTEIEEEKNEESDEALMNPVIPSLCLDITPSERRGRKEPVSLSKKSASLRKPSLPLVEYYDHDNPCTITQRQPPTVRVERTSLHCQTNAREAAEIESKEETERNVTEMGAVDDARIKRGKKALAKELVRRDFDRLMTRLDKLTREERVTRVTELPKLPPEVYMSEERTAMKIWKQQQDLESAFEGVLHGNLGINLKKDPLKPKNPLLVQQAIFPELRAPMDQESETSLQKLNVGICDYVAASSISGYEAGDSISSTHSSVNICGAESSGIKHAKTPTEIASSEKLIERTSEPQQPEGESEDLCYTKEELERRIKTAKSLLEESECEAFSIGHRQKQEVGECGHSSVNQDRKGRSAWWCSFNSEGVSTQHEPSVSVIEKEDVVQETSKTRKKIGVSKHSFAAKAMTLEELEKQRRKKICVSLDNSESSSSSHSSSWKVEEVHVRVKVGDQSSERESLDEESHISRPEVVSEGTLGQMKSQREKKRRKAEEKQEAKPKEFEDKPKLHDVREPRQSKEKPEVVSQGTQAGKDPTLKAERKRRERKEVKEQRLGIQPPFSDSSYLSPPSHQELSDTEQAKILLEEIRSQRKRLEKWAGLKEHEKGKVNFQLEDYIQRLLSMTRESVAELSVSDVSTPILYEFTPFNSDTSPLIERVLVPFPQKEFKDKAVGTSFDDSVENQERATCNQAMDQKRVIELAKNEEFHVDIPDHRVRKSSLEKKPSKKSPQLDTCIPPKELLSPVMVTPEHHFKPPSPPPPSPEYDELDGVYLQRISQLSARLTEIRKTQKKLLTASHSLGSESKSSPRSSTVSSPEDVRSYSEKSDSSKESEESLSTDSKGRRKSWEVLFKKCDDSVTPELLHASSVDDQDSEDSLLEKLFLESLQLSEPKKSFKPSVEMKAAQKNGSVKARPPPTTVKGGLWIGSDFPHELSTIVEVDSKVFSTTSLGEQKKDKELATSVIEIQYPEPLEDPLKTPDLIQPRRFKSPGLKIEPSSWLTDFKKLTSPITESSFLDVENTIPASEDVRISEETTKPEQQKEDDEKSNVSLPMSVSSFDDSEEVPENLDAVLRMLGISPTVLEPRKSPVSREGSPSSSPKSNKLQESPRITHSPPGSPLKDEPVVLPTADGDAGTNLGDQGVKEPATGPERLKSCLQFSPLSVFKDLSPGTYSSKSKGLDKSVGQEENVKGVVCEQPVNIQFTPIGSLRDFTFGSGSSTNSEPKSKVKDITPIAFSTKGPSFLEQESLIWRKKSSLECEKPDQCSPIISKETPKSMLKHSTPLHSFSGEGSSSSFSEERRKGRKYFPFIGDSAPSSISEGNASEGADWRNLDDEDESRE